MNIVLVDVLYGLTKTSDVYSYEINPFNKTATYPEMGNDTYSTVGFDLELKRHYTKHVLNFYLPSLLFVVASWMSFLIPPDAIPGRMSLLITLLLTQISLFSTVSQIQPPTKYPTALEIWILFCLILIFLALLAYAYLLLRMRCQAWSRGKSRALIKPASPIIQRGQIKETPAIAAQQKIQNYSQLDMIFLPCFPLLFLLFNLIYWPIIATETHLSLHQW